MIQLDGLNSTMSSVNTSSIVSSDQASLSDEYDIDLSSSFSSSDDDWCDIYSHHGDEDEIPVIVSMFKENVHNFHPPPVRKTNRQDNRLEKICQLPVIAVSNLQSMMPKIIKFCGRYASTEYWRCGKRHRKRNICLKFYVSNFYCKTSALY